MKIVSVQVNGPHPNDIHVILEDGSKLEGVAGIQFEGLREQPTYVMLKVLIQSKESAKS